MFLPILSASALIFSPLEAAGFLLGSIAVAIVITGCSPAEPEKNEAENQSSSAAEVSSEGQKAAVDSTAPSPTKTVPAPKTAMSPKETYIQMMAELRNGKTFEDRAVVFLRYASKARIANLEAERTRFNAMTEEQKERYNSGERLEAITTIQERIQGSTAILNVTTQSGDKRLVEFVLENNQWKWEDEGSEG